MLKQKIMEWAVSRQRKRWVIPDDYNVETYLKKIVKYFDKTKAGNRSLVVVYEFHDSGENNGVWTISINNGICHLLEGEPKEYDTKLYMTAEVYGRILKGQLDFTRVAYSVGAIRYYGNTLGHRELNSYLTIPRDGDIAAL